MANIGFFLTYLCFLASVYGAVAAFAAALTRHRRLYLSSKASATLTTVFVLAAAGILITLLYARDYSVLYIAKNSSNDLPPLYTLTAFWSSLEGSHFFWTILLSLMTTIAIWTHARDNEHIMPYFLGTLASVQAWMFYLLISHSDPFKVQLPAPANGLGMNELLQNPYMAIHPPLLFTGYTATAVPFGYAVAALFYGDITEGWLKAVRRWTLVAFSFLSVAIALGGKWAYVELGWAGYWAWDPVENSSFLPWLLTTCLLHILIVQEKLGHLKRLSLVVAIAAFFFTFFGTFITRSGVISSVHAFGEGPIGPNYLTFLAILATGAALLYAVRAPSILPSEHEKVWGIAKESAIALMLFLLLAFLAIVFIGTVFPIVSEAITDQRISVQAPYFNIFAPYVGLAMVALIGFGNLMRFQTSKIPGLKPVTLIAATVSLPLTLLFLYGAGISADFHNKAFYAQTIGFYFVCFSALFLGGDFVIRLQAMKFRLGFFLRRNLGYVGGFIAHVGFLLIIVGFLGNYRALEKKVTLKSHESAELFGYEFTFQDGIDVTNEANATLFAAPLKVTRAGKEIYQLRPAQSFYPTKPGQSFNEIAVEGNFWQDIYVVLNDFDRSTGKQVTLSIHINPTVRIVWLAVVVFFVGGMVALFDKYRGNHSRDVVAGRWDLGEVRS